MTLYAHYGFHDFIMCLGYKGSMVKEYFLNYEAMHNDLTIHLGEKHTTTYHDAHAEQDFNVTLTDTGIPSMTGARVKMIERYIDEDTFMVTYGDGLSDVNIQALAAFHKEHGRLATITTVRPISRFGILNINDEGQVSAFAEKPHVDGWINAGHFVFHRKVFDYLSDDPSCMLEDTFLKTLAEERQLMAYQHTGFFFAMDTYREYLHLNELWESGAAPWALWLKKERVDAVKKKLLKPKFAVNY
jgi:glucose-1-phosphate cytidylyltransferase